MKILGVSGSLRADSHNTALLRCAGRHLPEGVELSQPRGSLPVAEGIQECVFGVPWFKRYRPEIIEEYALAFRKVVEGYRDLLPSRDPRLKPEAW